MYTKLNGMEMDCRGTERWLDLLARLPDGGAGALGICIEGRTRSLLETVEEYAIQIVKVYPDSGEDCRDFLIRVTDQRLLDATGGIVQGMSGSPILQDGRLVGAVTHVMVDDPTSGYGIYAGRMLQQCGG